MFERFQEIMRVASEASDDPLKTADKVEEMRCLSKCTMQSWAKNTESKVADQLKESHPNVQQRKKTLKWYCTFGLVEVQERIWRHSQVLTSGRWQPGLQVPIEDVPLAWIECCVTLGVSILLSKPVKEF